MARPAFERGAPEFVYDVLPEMGGALANYPIIDNLTPDILAEVSDGWRKSVAAGEGQVMESFDGDVWSIQLTARPGYYVSPEVQDSLGWAEGEVPDGY